MVVGSNPTGPKPLTQNLTTPSATLVMPRWAIVVQVCQIFIGMSGQGFTTSEPKCTGALFGRLFKRMNFGLRSCGLQRSWAICRKVEMHCPRWRGALPPLAAWPNCIEVASSPIHVSSRHQKSIVATLEGSSNVLKRAEARP